MSTRRNAEKHSPEGLARHFVRYAEGMRASFPLYGRLLLAVADDPDLLALAGAARRDQPAGLLLLAAVHVLLLRVAIEPSDAGHSVLSLYTYRYGRQEKRRLAVCDYHEMWLAWRTTPTR